MNENPSSVSIIGDKADERRSEGSDVFTQTDKNPLVDVLSPQSLLSWIDNKKTYVSKYVRNISGSQQSVLSWPANKKTCLLVSKHVRNISGCGKELVMVFVLGGIIGCVLCGCLAAVFVSTNTFFKGTDVKDHTEDNLNPSNLWSHTPLITGSHTPPIGECDFYQSLMPNASMTSNFISELGSVSWYSRLTDGYVYLSHECNRRGVLKVTPSSAASYVDIYVGICNPLGFSINIGDSDTNNGYGGDGGTSDGWAAEIHNLATSLLIYENVAWKMIGPPVGAHNYVSYFHATESTRWNVKIDRCNKVTMNTVPERPGTHHTIADDNMFRFDDFYIGLNRVISTSGRSGTGVCNICIKFGDDSNHQCSYGVGYNYCTC